MNETKYHIGLITKEIENIHSNFIDLMNIQRIIEIYSSLRIIKLSCIRLIEINEYNDNILNKIISNIDSISINNLIYSNKDLQIDSLFNLAYIIGIIVTLFDSYL